MKSHKLLSRHWNLYYMELGKFQKALREGGVSWNSLEQWCKFLSETHEPSEPLEEKFRNNKGIRKVHEMLQEFTEDERLREQYRLHEAWLRDQRTMERERVEIKEKLAAETRLRKKAEAELKEREKRSVMGLREAGYADERIADMLDIPEDRVKAVRK
ncbi:PD-(D/E)XK nuclease family transposase [Desulfonema magnum]|uniref:PD-(D/E)XK nuclease family transposase n=1 Tax=Desulfonema magnum TaxID=45655 RepID=UPI001A9B1FA5|nr:PD-(D/E)XK nuclease family transposase [Desulfonema magnum]